MPLTTPVVELTDATEGLLLAHVPPGVASVSVIEEPRQIAPAPVMDDGVGVIVTMTVVRQPVPSVYVITAVPAVIPVTTPVPAPTEATDVLLLLHAPPPVASLSVVVAPTHALAVPVITDGVGDTVNVAVVLQPVGSV